MIGAKDTGMYVVLARVGDVIDARILRTVMPLFSLVTIARGDGNADTCVHFYRARLKPLFTTGSR